jgi:hypothetical protein
MRTIRIAMLRRNAQMATSRFVWLAVVGFLRLTDKVEKPLPKISHCDRPADSPYVQGFGF